MLKLCVNVVDMYNMSKRNKAKEQAKETLVKVQLPADLYSYAEAGKLLRLSVRTLQSQVKAGALRCVRIRRRVYFTEGQLLDFVESCRQEARG